MICTGLLAPSPSFDHLVGAGKKRRRQSEAERLGGFEIDDELKFSRVLHRLISQLLQELSVLDRMATPSLELSKVFAALSASYRSAG